MFDPFYAVLAAVSSLAVKSAVGRWGYSGRGDHPMFGDFEAQRHWMEITASLPIGDWYRNSTDNDLQYWGLDYPPLTAYVSWIFGMLAKCFYPSLVKLGDSRAFEEPGGKLFMRTSVILTDIITLIPAIICCVELLSKVDKGQAADSKNSKKRTNIADATESAKILVEKSDQSDTANKHQLSTFLLLLVCLSCPAIVLVDHGHFQYNGVCIGLSLLGAISILKDQDVIGSILFCLALNFKQMALYYAPVFFFVLLRKCFDKLNWYQKCIHLIKVGSAVIFSFFALWWPFCFYAHESETCISSLLLVLARQFPFSRGIFEDKVANIWYAASIVFDFRKHFSISFMAKMSLCLTLLLLSPIAVDLLSRKITPRRLFLSLVNSSLAFFLASFQVHEKSLLLSLVPALLLVQYQPLLLGWFQILGVFTMFPMLVRDGLRIPYFAICAIFLSLMVLFLDFKNDELKEEEETDSKKKVGSKDSSNSNIYRRFLNFFLGASILGMAILHYAEVSLPAPPRYPDLYPALFSLFGAMNLFVMYCIGIIWQMNTQ